LFREADLRATVVATADSYTANAQAPAKQSYEANIQQLHTLAGAGLPMGWGDARSANAPWHKKALGWLITALAVTLGAPFWFDLLNKFMSVRSTVKPKPTAKVEETTSPREISVPRIAVTTHAANDSLFREREAVPLPFVTANFERHEWVDGREDGLL
jgi:hypothetical protein